ncbi:MAG: Cyclic-nucleotide-regulated bacteriocin/lantibiotic efflux ABC transporter, permease/ATP-binding protein [uncultured Paraburkholderia sp.]|nr:MAG: Cyclic-nucleotide-regulated bacteriocin/lantibiotic efflux ABC transporter, permease/ATP-binding protein [uncultured Paraburkholderia sp.]
MDAPQTAPSAAEFLASVEILSPFSRDEIERLVEYAQARYYSFGETVCSAGETADGLYIVRSGSVRIFVEEHGKETSMGVRKSGEIFADIAMLRTYVHEASVRASAKTELLFIPRAAIEPVITGNQAALAFVAQLFDLRDKLNKAELEEYVRSVGVKRVAAGKEILKQDARDDRRLYVVRQGEVRIVRHEEGRDYTLATLGEGEIFGEKACLMRQEQMACAIASTDTRLLVIPERTVHFILERNPKLREVLDERIRYGDRELQRQKRLEQRRKLPLMLDLQSKPEFGEKVIRRFPLVEQTEVVVYGLSSEYVWLADSALGFRKLTVEDFERGWSGTCLLFTGGPHLVQMSAARSPWIRFVGYLKPYRKILGHLFLATFVIQVLGVIPPLIIQNILDGVIVHQNVSLLHLLIGGLIIANVFSQLMASIRAYLANFMVHNMDFAMMSQFFKHTLSLPFSFFAKRKTGDIFARFQENQTIRAFLTESTVTTALNLLMVFIYFTIVFVYNVKMTLVLIGFVIPIMALTALATPKIKNYAREVFTASTESKSFLMEALAGVETVKGMGIERPVRLRWEKKYAKALEVQYRAHAFNILVGLGSQLLNAATTIAILWVGANLVLAREMTIGQLIAFNAFMGSVLGPLMGLVGLWSMLNDAGVAMERLGDVLDIEPEQKPEDLPSRVMLPELQGEISLSGVYFRYGDNDSAYVLENISFDIKPGELVAIVGRSGSGKTTLAKLLVGFYAPSEGKMSIDGYDLSVVDKAYYRAQIGYVMQSNLLFSGTIAENIASGDDAPDRRRIEEVERWPTRTRSSAKCRSVMSRLSASAESVCRAARSSGSALRGRCITIRVCSYSTKRRPRWIRNRKATSSAICTTY